MCLQTPTFLLRTGACVTLDFLKEHERCVCVCEVTRLSAAID